MQLQDFKILTFDCYGTLIDWESGMYAALEPLAARAKPRLPRDQVLEAHSRHEAAQELATPGKNYRELLAIVYKRLAEEWEVPAAWEECLAYGQSIRDWPAFTDSAEALAYLKKYYRLAILSNVDNESFAHSNKKLGVTFDAIFTAEDIGTYKPSERNFNYMLDKLKARGIEKKDILHTAESLFHDIKPGGEIGLATCWIHRRHAQSGFGATVDPGVVPRHDFRFTSLAELASAHAQEKDA
jgi:2-haloacid dehalogenase/putative hydrolase of the HAD superfamily